MKKINMWPCEIVPIDQLSANDIFSNYYIDAETGKTFTIYRQDNGRQRWQDDFSIRFQAVEKENQPDTIIHVKTYAGHFSFDMARVFPASKKDFKLLLDIIQEDMAADQHTEKIQTYINNELAILVKLRNGENQPAQKAKYTSQIKKWQTMYNDLAARFNFEAVSDAENVKFSSCYVYAMKTDNTGRPAACRFPGHKFTKYDRVFHVYKAGRSHYVVIVPAYGLQLVTGNTKAAAAAAINENLIARLADMENLKTF